MELALGLKSAYSDRGALRSAIGHGKEVVKEVPFDPMVFLATVDGGRTISKYRKNETIFRQGDPADAVFYIQKGKVKITVISEHGKCCASRTGRILRRGMPDRTAAAYIDSHANDGLRDYAVGEGGYHPRSP